MRFERRDVSCEYLKTPFFRIVYHRYQYLTCETLNVQNVQCLGLSVYK